MARFKSFVCFHFFPVVSIKCCGGARNRKWFGSQDTGAEGEACIEAVVGGFDTAGFLMVVVFSWFWRIFGW